MTLASWQDSYDKPRQCIKKQRHHFVDKGLYSQGCCLSSGHVWMWELDHKAGWIIEALKLWCWRIFLRVPLTARRSNQSIVKEVNPEYSLEGLMLKLKLQYVGHLVRIANLLEKTLMLGKMEGKGEEGNKRWDGWMAMDMSLTKLWEMVKDWDAWYAAVHWAAKIWTWFGDWTTARLVKWDGQRRLLWGVINKRWEEPHLLRVRVRMFEAQGALQHTQNLCVN